jgi:Zn-dependent protease with chaperone function
MRRRRTDSVGQERVGHAAPQRRWLLFGVLLAIMLGMAAAITFSPAAVFAYDFALAEHVGALCLVAISRVIAPLHHVFEGLIVAGLALSSWDRIRAWRESRRLIGAVDLALPEPESPLAVAAGAAGVDRSRIVEVKDCPVPAFTSGALFPRVYVSSRVESLLTHDELVSVLAHEGEHLRRRDPLRLSVMRFVSRTLFWLPAVRSLEQHMAEETELRADAAAAGITGVATASALLTLVRNFGRVASPAMSAALSQHEFIELRVRLLTGQNGRTFSRVRPGALLATTAVLLLLWGAAMAELHQSAHGEHVVPHTHTINR